MYPKRQSPLVFVYVYAFVLLLYTPMDPSKAKVGRPARTYIQQLCEDTGCSPENLPEAMNDREKWRERVRDIRAGGTTWWWWWLLLLLRSLWVYNKSEQMWNRYSNTVKKFYWNRMCLNLHFHHHNLHITISPFTV